MTQFEANLGIMTSNDLKRINNLNVVLIGAGGLGGHLANSLVRLGIQHLSIIDPDCFTLSNLNRQLFSSHETLDDYKVDVLKAALMSINPTACITVYKQRVQEVDIQTAHNVDIIIDAVDSIETRLYLERTAEAMNVPLLHGAIAGWYGQLGLFTPGKSVLKSLYGDASSGAEKELKSPTFTPAIIANMMVGELVKFIQGSSEALVNKLFMVDFKHHTYEIVLDVSNNEVIR